ncbi:hypothetical protein KEM09_18880 [Carboxylicivirga mesophila]|uniref:Calx-beta domain-containing protein n=1 Tax=Carboxylicivirga mesophila TaxID=1166478 RepID=A0ABS5KFB6_9BACT|nr:Calx-beta domain-containing protein [Carboxylicivirga mesophila]MBS2213482.1 hypothetical protein [Carboxylicivirga mesophila]
MKKINKIIAVFIAGLILFSSCGEAEKQTFKDKDAFFGFETTSSVMLENDIRTLRIPIALAKSTGVGEVTFEVVTEDFSNPAIEGEDFTIKNAGNTVSFEGDYIKNVEIKMIDNYLRDGDKKFKLVLKENNIGATIGLANEVKTEHIVTISDNEHPLAALIGVDFESTEQSISKDNDGDQIAPYVLPVEIRPETEEGRDDLLLVKGLLGVAQEVRMRFDLETGIVTLEKNQNYTDVLDPYFGINIQLTFFGWEWYVKEDGTEGVKRFDEAVGTFDLDKREIVFEQGYLAQITAPGDHPYLGKAYNTLVIEHSRIAKKQ